RQRHQRGPLLVEHLGHGHVRQPRATRVPGGPVAEVFDEERAALMPLPSTAFDPVRWESRTADKYGLVDIDSNRYLAGPDSARSRVLAAIRWDTVTLTSPATGELFAEYPRQYGRSRNVEDPALVLPRLAVKPRAWRESSIRPDVPDDIRAWLDSMDEKTLRESLKAIGDACRAAGFDPAMQACGEILRSNRDMGLHADSLTPIALRMRDGEWEYPGGIEEPDLSGYDRFITGTDDGGEER
ncbi:Mu transposase domain-containing protein, partial [Bifidobacterium longum]|uniref:Mu transposase domain-containing protein n=1 Tax=Bifidobacterium longum TaxID=216816 RepID=UPI003BFA68E8